MSLMVKRPSTKGLSSQYQVLLDAKIYYFMHDNVGSALSRAVVKFPEDTSGHLRLLSVKVPISLSFSLSCLLGSRSDICFGGLSIWRTVFVSVFSVFCVRFGLDKLLFATRWSRHLFEDHNPSFIFMRVV
jgi:hypothetical protein